MHAFSAASYGNPRANKVLLLFISPYCEFESWFNYIVLQYSTFQKWHFSTTYYIICFSMLLFLFFSFFNALTLNELGTGYFQPLGSASPRFLLLSSYFLSLFAPRMRSLNFIIFVGLVFFFWLPILVKFGGIETLYVLITGKLLQPLELSRSDWRSGSGIYLSIRGPTAFFDDLMSVIYIIEIDSGRGWITLD